jgi:3-methyladenine DNA glycosylase AlkC
MVDIPSKKSKKPRAQKIDRLSEEILNKPFPKSKQINISGDKPFTITSYSAVEYNSIKSPVNQKDVLDRIDDKIKVSFELLPHNIFLLIEH